ncbi:hypothetical protein K501DRAFT_265003 [Backusella circina FSU 941]|nr:hypothetical protein K501DRAFT_265003 [Backusella circina FSU 941]
MPNLSIHKPSRLWSRNTTTHLEDTPSKSRQDRAGLIGLFTNEHKSRKRSSDDDNNEEEEPKRKKQRKESVTRFLKKCIPKKKPATITKQEPPPCEIDVTNPFKLPVIEWTGGCIYFCLSEIDFDNKKDQEYEDIMHFPKPPNWRASVPQANQNNRRQRKESCPSRFFNNALIGESSDDESDMPRTPTSDHETLLLSKIENLNILS